MPLRDVCYCCCTNQRNSKILKLLLLDEIVEHEKDPDEALDDSNCWEVKNNGNKITQAVIENAKTDQMLEGKWKNLS